MIFLLSGFISYHAPEDSCCIWMMDMLLAFPRMQEESLYYSGIHGIRYTAGCLDLYKWYHDFGIRGKTEVWKNVFLEWRMRDYRNYQDTVNYLLFSLEKSRFFIYTTASYLKRKDELGVGWRNRQVEVRVGIPHIFHNFAYDRTPERDRDSMRYYSPMPVGIHIRTLIPHGFIRAFSEGDWIPEMQYRMGNTYYRESYFRGEAGIELPFAGCFFYGYLWKGDKFYVSECFIVPYLFFKIKDHRIRVEYGWERKISEDTTSYKRLHHGVSIYGTWRIFFYGFQRTWRRRWVNGEEKPDIYGDVRTRFLVGIRFRMRGGGYFELVEGLRPNPDKIQHVHYHTYLKFIYSF